jgi:PhoPQ-activated pathogenicity-related protein
MPKGLSAVFCSLMTAVFASAASAEDREQTALDRYVAAPDPSYRYEPVSTKAGDAYTANVLEITSQQWRTADEVDRPIWKLWLTIVRPEHVTTHTGLLVISGGSNEKPPPKINALLTRLALATNSVMSEVRMVPNEPLVFAGDGRKLTEDAITAFSWEKFLTTGDETWPLRLPMTKSVVRAMDIITSFCVSPAGGGLSVDKFVGRRRLEAGLDGMDRRRGRQSRRCHHPRRDRPAQPRTVIRSPLPLLRFLGSRDS